MKEFLSRNGRAFIARNIDEDDAAYGELIALGYRTVPLTIIEGRSIKGFDEPALRAAIAGISER